MLDEADLSIETYVANMGVVLTDMAYYPCHFHLVWCDRQPLGPGGQAHRCGDRPGGDSLPDQHPGLRRRWHLYSAVYGDSNEVANRGFVYAYTLETLQGTSNLDYDFDGSGRVDGGDVQALLDYATGARRPLRRPKTEISMGTEL